MCPFCVATTVWVAAGVVSTGGVSALVASKIWSKLTGVREEGGSNDKQ